MIPPLTAYYREPLATMDTLLPLPLHLSKLRPCAHCGGRSWAWHTEQCCWLCQCYWHPEWRHRYQDRIPEAEQPQLPSGGLMVVCNRRQCHAVALPEEAWWTQ